MARAEAANVEMEVVKVVEVDVGAVVMVEAMAVAVKEVAEMVH